MRHKGFICSERERAAFEKLYTTLFKQGAGNIQLVGVDQTTHSSRESQDFLTNTTSNVCPNMFPHCIMLKDREKGISHPEQQSLTVHKEFIPSSEMCPGCRHSI